jgi:hypothetical protein
MISGSSMAMERLCRRGAGARVRQPLPWCAWGRSQVVGARAAAQGRLACCLPQAQAQAHRSAKSAAGPAAPACRPAWGERAAARRASCIGRAAADAPVPVRRASLMLASGGGRTPTSGKASATNGLWCMYSCERRSARSEALRHGCRLQMPGPGTTDLEVMQKMVEAGADPSPAPRAVKCRDGVMVGRSSLILRRFAPLTP